MHRSGEDQEKQEKRGPKLPQGKVADYILDELGFNKTSKDKTKTKTSDFKTKISRLEKAYGVLSRGIEKRKQYKPNDTDEQDAKYNGTSELLNKLTSQLNALNLKAPIRELVAKAVGKAESVGIIELDLQTKYIESMSKELNQSLLKDINAAADNINRMLNLLCNVLEAKGKGSKANLHKAIIDANKSDIEKIFNLTLHDDDDISAVVKSMIQATTNAVADLNQQMAALIKPANIAQAGAASATPQEVSGPSKAEIAITAASEDFIAKHSKELSPKARKEEYTQQLDQRFYDRLARLLSPGASHTACIAMMQRDGQFYISTNSLKDMDATSFAKTIDAKRKVIKDYLNGDLKTDQALDKLKAIAGVTDVNKKDEHRGTADKRLMADLRKLRSIYRERPREDKASNSALSAELKSFLKAKLNIVVPEPPTKSASAKEKSAPTTSKGLLDFHERSAPTEGTHLVTLQSNKEEDYPTSEIHAEIALSAIVYYDLDLSQPAFKRESNNSAPAEKEQVVIGIPKLCCQKCEHEIPSIKEVLDDRNVELSVRGAHGQQYTTSAITFTGESIEEEKLRYKQIASDNQYADASESSASLSTSRDSFFHQPTKTQQQSQQKEQKKAPSTPRQGGSGGS